jgi:hypothetical protein
LVTLLVVTFVSLIYVDLVVVVARCCSFSVDCLFVCCCCSRCFVRCSVGRCRYVTLLLLLRCSLFLLLLRSFTPLFPFVLFVPLLSLIVVDFCLPFGCCFVVHVDYITLFRLLPLLFVCCYCYCCSLFNCVVAPPAFHCCLFVVVVTLLLLLLLLNVTVFDCCSGIRLLLFRSLFWVLLIMFVFDCVVVVVGGEE